MEENAEYWNDNEDEDFDSGLDIDMLFGQLAMYLRRESIIALLARNDTRCFTTEQYVDTYERISAPNGNTIWKKQVECDPELPRMHIESTGLVTEVSPNIWAVKDI